MLRPGASEPATTVTVDPSAGGVASQDDSLPEIGEWVYRDGVWVQVGGYSDEFGDPVPVFTGEIIRGPGSEGDIKSIEDWEVIAEEGGFVDGTYTQDTDYSRPPILDQEGTAATEQTDAVKAVDWILVNLPNYKDMTEVEINQALEGAGLKPVDINNDGTITSKTEAATNGDVASTVTVTGGNGNNTLSGGDSNDTLKGGDGNNTLNGGNGNDTLKGGNGNDTVTVGNGNDTISGGNGNDTVVDVVSNGVTGVTVGNGKGPDDGPGDGPGDNGGDGLDGTGMLTALAALPTMAAQPFEPLTQRSIRFDAPTIQPVQIAPTDARKELDNQLARLLNDPQSQRKQSLFGGLV